MPSNLERKAQRKRQTRLTFDPVDRSSSPATRSPAKVRYELASSSKRTPSSSRRTTLLEDNSDSDNDIRSSVPMKKGTKLDFKSLSTAKKSSQKVEKGGDSSDTLEAEEEDEVMPARTTRSTRSSTQAKLPAVISKGKRKESIFDASPSRSQGSMFGAQVVIPVKHNGKSGRKTAQISALAPSDSDESSLEDEFTLPVKQKGTPAKKTVPVPIELDSDSEEEPLKKANGESKKDTKPTPKRATRGSTRQMSLELSSDESDEHLLPLPKSKPTQRKQIFGRPHTSSSATTTPVKGVKKSINIESSDEEDPIISSPRRSQKLPYKNTEDSEDEDIRSSPPKRRRPMVQLGEDEDEDEDEEPIISPLKRRRPAIDSGDSDISPSKRHRSAAQDEETESDANSDSDLPSPSQISSRKAPPRKSQDKTPLRHTRQQTAKRHRTEKEKTLELLKRRREGEKIDELTESESESEDEDDSDDEFQKLSDFEDEEEEPQEIKKPEEQSKGVADDDDFVVEDEDAPLGIPDHLNLMMPLEFTHAAHKPLKEHFRDAVEWMIHNKINPGFSRDDEVYRQAFKKLHDECYGLAKSKFSSTQWTAEFTRALYARPHIIIDHLRDGEGVSIEGLPKCDACNHRKHQPSSAIQFEGRPYDPTSLEELDQNDSDDEDSVDSDDSESGSVDINGHHLPKQEKRWSAGNVCKTNAEKSHSLLHWRFHLNEWVVDELEAEGELTPEKLVERNKMKRKHLNKYANELVDKWQAAGTIKGLYRDFKNQLEAAREATLQKRGGWK